VTLSCSAPTATISLVVFADWGLPTGTCGGRGYKSSNCSSAANTTAIVTELCVGKHSCTISPLTQLSHPCVGTTKKNLVIEVACTSQVREAALN
jgi:hypothetical protein